MIRAICRVQSTEAGPVSLGLIDDATVRMVPGIDLATLIGQVGDITELRAAVEALAPTGEALPLELVVKNAGAGWPRLLAPVDQQECWGAGCTYRVADDALGPMKADRPLYASAYEADRPMLFYKGSPRHVSGPGEPIVCREGARQTIPEAELTVLLAPSGSILGYALGNDVSAVDLEQANPLYQPQSKVFDGGAAVGPWWTLADSAGADAMAPFTCVVHRSGSLVLEQSIDPGRLVRRLEDLARWLFEAASFPLGVALMTGGGAGVPPGFGLAGGDLVVIAHPVLGTLANPVGLRRPAAR